MRPAQPRQIVAVIVPVIVVQVGDSQAGWDLEAANNTASEWVRLVGDPLRLSLVSFSHRKHREPTSDFAMPISLSFYTNEHVLSRILRG